MGRTSSKQSEGLRANAAAGQALDGLLHLAEVAASMDGRTAGTPGSHGHMPAHQFLEQQAAVAEFMQQQQLQQRQQAEPPPASALSSAASSNVVGVMQQLQLLKDALGLSAGAQGQHQQQKQWHSSMPSGAGDAARATHSTAQATLEQPGDSHLLPHPGALPSLAGGVLVDSLTGFIPIPSVRSGSGQGVAAGTGGDESTDEDYTAGGITSKLQRWSSEEHSQLEQLVAHYGVKNWSAVASHLPGRTGKQCRERCLSHTARPKKVSGNWRFHRACQRQGPGLCLCGCAVLMWVPAVVRLELIVVACWY